MRRVIMKLFNLDDQRSYFQLTKKFIKFTFKRMRLGN